MEYFADLIDEVYYWCHNGIISVNYGLLYNWYAATDVREICAEGWHVPTEAEFQTLIDYLGGDGVAGGKLKETGFVYWNSPNTDATNEVNFYSRGSGYRETDGSFADIQEFCPAWSCDDAELADEGTTAALGYHADAEAYIWEEDRKTGMAIRPIKDSTTLSHGQTGIYIDPSSYTYPTICIGIQEWVACNIRTEHYRNGDLVPEVQNNIAWAALVTGALCAYNNNWANV